MASSRRDPGRRGRALAVRVLRPGREGGTASASAATATGGASVRPLKRSARRNLGARVAGADGARAARRGRGAPAAPPPALGRSSSSGGRSTTGGRASSPRRRESKVAGQRPVELASLVGARSRRHGGAVQAHAHWRQTCQVPKSATRAAGDGAREDTAAAAGERRRRVTAEGRPP